MWVHGVGPTFQSTALLRHHSKGNTKGTRKAGQAKIELPLLPLWPERRRRRRRVLLSRRTGGRARHACAWDLTIGMPPDLSLFVSSLLSSCAVVGWILIDLANFFHQVHESSCLRPPWDRKAAPLAEMRWVFSFPLGPCRLTERHVKSPWVFSFPLGSYRLTWNPLERHVKSP